MSPVAAREVRQFRTLVRLFAYRFFDTEILSLRGDIATLISPYPSGLYLLRPDRYVAAYFAPHQSGAMSKDIEMLCASTLGRTDSPRVHGARRAEVVA